MRAARGATADSRLGDADATSRESFYGMFSNAVSGPLPANRVIWNTIEPRSSHIVGEKV